jgi:hypothetical protein
MSMKALNQLVARSIIDPAVVMAFRAGRIGDVLADLDFTPDLRQQIAGIESASWAEFAVLSYRYVKAAEKPVARIQLPSPLTGLIDDDAQSSEEQVA